MTIIYFFARNPSCINCLASSVAALFICDLLFPSYSFAVQAHGGAEGLVAHQIGHLLLTAGMMYLLFCVISASHTRFSGPGWFEFKWFLWLIIGWNFVTFFGHMMLENIDSAKFIKLSDSNLTSAFFATKMSDYFFYLTNLDHLILIPSFVFLAIALKKWGENS